METNENHELDQYCGFKIAGEEFAIPVTKIQEVIRKQLVTPIPLSPSEVNGLINLRGQIVTSLSLRRLFAKDEQNEGHMNIIVRGPEGLFSLVVDEVTDIINIEEDNLENSPQTISPNLKKFVDRIYKAEDHLVVLLNVDAIVNLGEREEAA